MRVGNSIVSTIVILFVIIVAESNPGFCQAWTLEAIGIRGGLNFQDAGLPPGEKEDFEQFDIFGIIGLPWGWEFPSGWEIRWRLNGSAGALRGSGDLGFIATAGPGIAFTKKSWHMTFDLGMGGAVLSDWKFGSQDIGGPFQFIGHGGATYHVLENFSIGYRFHHMSDATIYGSSRGVDFHMLEFSYHF